jgi:hypothetical protein
MGKMEETTPENPEYDTTNYFCKRVFLSEQIAIETPQYHV